MGGCASKPKESDIFEGNSTEKAQTHNVAKENANEGGANQKEEVSVEEGAEQKKEAEAKQDSSDASAPPAKPEPEPEPEPASEAVKAGAAPADTPLEKAPAETGPPKQEAGPADKSPAASTSENDRTDAPLVVV